MKIEQKSDRHVVKKSWGYEEWVVNNDQYCGKRLHFNVRNGRTSLHFHAIKHETMYVESGVFEIEIQDPATTEKTLYQLAEGESLVISPMTMHRITCLEISGMESIMIEFSTHHEDSDSYRISR